METFLLNMAVIIGCATIVLDVAVIIYVIVDVIDELRWRWRK